MYNPRVRCIQPLRTFDGREVLYTERLVLYGMLESPSVVEATEHDFLNMIFPLEL